MELKDSMRSGFAFSFLLLINPLFLYANSPQNIQTVREILEQEASYGSLVFPISKLEKEELQIALEDLTPDLFSTLKLVQENNDIRVRSCFSNRSYAMMDTCSPMASRKINLWLDTFGDFLEQYSHHQLPGIRANTFGFAVASDNAWNPSNITGILAAYTYSDAHFKEDKGRAILSSIYLGLYHSFHLPHFYWNMALLSSYEMQHIRRQLSSSDIPISPSSDHNGGQWIGHIETGFKGSFSSIILRPFDALDVIYEWEEGFTEKHFPGYELKVNPSKGKLIRNETGLHLIKCIFPRQLRCTLDFKGSWIKEWRSLGHYSRACFVGGSSSFTLENLYPNRTIYSIGAAFTSYLFQDKVILSLRYNGEFGSPGYQDSNINFLFNWGF